MFFSFSSSAKGQTTQTTPFIEARKEKTREFQTQLLHYFSKSDNESNHHHPPEAFTTLRPNLASRCHRSECCLLQTLPLRFTTLNVTLPPSERCSALNADGDCPG